MAREYAQIKLAIWADDDWRELSPMARYLYLTLLTSPTLSHCGVADWRPSRIGALNGMDADDVEAAGAELIEALYLVIDEESEEVLIRSFIRNDGLMKQPRMAVSMANAHAAVASKVIRGVIVHELIRLHHDLPDLAGWGKDKASHLLGLAPVDPSTYPLGRGSFRGAFTPGLGQTHASVSGSPTPSPTPSPATAPISLSPDAASAAKRPARATQRPDDFRPTQAHIDLASERGVDLATEWANFCDWCDANGKAYKDWSAALRTWIRKARPTRQVAGRPSNTQQHLALAQELAAQESNATIFEIGGSR